MSIIAHLAPMPITVRAQLTEAGWKWIPLDALSTNTKIFATTTVTLPRAGMWEFMATPTNLLNLARLLHNHRHPSDSRHLSSSRAVQACGHDCRDRHRRNRQQRNRPHRTTSLMENAREMIRSRIREIISS